MERVTRFLNISELETKGTFPHLFIDIVKMQFLDWYKAEGTGESLEDFCLSSSSCIYILETEKDDQFLLQNLLDIEFVEREECKGCVYFRIGFMNDHQMNLVYFLEGSIGDRLEKWLQQ
ncbi:hypothetical protein [Bacillus sp. SJS]|uniref:hypothetical protein n=1 Tax=Bacillus sp. SJS TaxID=1423321 RepID=UPI000A4CEAE9|nr:hypothetical protein [Bacillus sp. SJS]